MKLTRYQFKRHRIQKRSRPKDLLGLMDYFTLDLRSGLHRRASLNAVQHLRAHVYTIVGCSYARTHVKTASEGGIELE